MSTVDKDENAEANANANAKQVEETTGPGTSEMGRPVEGIVLEQVSPVQGDLFDEVSPVEGIVSESPGETQEPTSPANTVSKPSLRSQSSLRSQRSLVLDAEQTVGSPEEMEQSRKQRAQLRDLEVQVLLGYAEGDAPKLSHLLSLRSLMGIITGSIVVCAGFASWPMKNPMDDPDHWWECMLQCATIWSLATAAFLITTMCSVMIGNFQLLPVKNFVIVFFSGACGIVGWWSAYYAVWVKAFDMPYPAPWHGGTSGPVAFFLMAGMVWFTFPKTWRRDKRFQRQMLWMFLCLFLSLVSIVTYWILMVAFFFWPKDYQWILAFAVPVVREVSVYFVTKTGCKAADNDNLFVVLVLQHGVLCTHALFLSVCMMALSTDATNVILLALDFCNNLYLCYVVLRNHKHEEEARRAKCIDALFTMLLSEVLELFIPLAYLVCFLVAFNGPNKSVLGNIGAERWQYGKVENDEVGSAVTIILVFAGIDALSLVISAAALWLLRGINLWTFFLYMQKELGFVLTVQQAWALEQQFCTIALGCAMDATFSGDWW